jgi:hypothetical protein
MEREQVSSRGEYRVTASRLAWVPNGLHYFGCRLALSLAMVDPDTDSESVGASPPIQNEKLQTASPLFFSPFQPHYVAFVPVFPTLPSASNTSFLSWRNGRRVEAMAEELRAQAESNDYERGAHRGQDGIRDNMKHNDDAKEQQKENIGTRYVMLRD